MSNPDNPNTYRLRWRAERLLRAEDDDRAVENLTAEEARALIRELRIHQIELEIQNEELVEAQHELAKSNERLIDLYDFAPVGYLTVSHEGEIEELNITAARLLGRPRPAINGGWLYHFIEPEDVQLYSHHRLALLESGADDTCELRMTRGDGSIFDAQLQSTPVRNKAGEISALRTAMTDISDRKATERAWKQADTIIRASNEGLVVVDPRKRVTRINPALSVMTQFDRADLLGRDIASLIKQTPEDGIGLLWDTLLEERQWQGELHFERRDDRPFPARVSFVALTDERDVVVGYAGLITDITEQKRAEMELRHQAYYDPLTGVPNRALLTERLKIAAREAHRHGNLVSLMFVDLDKFKETNDRLGHAAGDTLLQAVADRLCYCVRDHDTVARVGGDEFAVVLTDVDSVQSVVTVADKILETLRPPVWLAGQPVRCHASIGIAIYPIDAQDTDTLCQYADLAMYRSKASEEMSYSFFKESMTQQARQHLRTQRELTRALERDEFRVYYQPILDVASGELAGAEALLRWEHPKHGLLLPPPFLAVAEDTGQIMALGGWVLDTVGRQWSEWFADRHEDEIPFLSINVSPRQLHHPDALAQTMKQVKECALPAHRISLEITESIAINSSGDGAYEYLLKLKQLGVRIAMDDFGTGYSSLGYLRRLPFDVIKIDRSFIQDLENGDEAVHLVSAIIQMAHGLNMTVVAEGVETEGQRDYLRRCQCDYIQGNLVSPPLPADSMQRYLRQGLPS